jgi:transposase InsO family protein
MEMQCVGEGVELLMHQDESSQQWRVVVPKAMRNVFLSTMHGSAWAGHQSPARTAALARRHGWWASWTTDTVFWAEHCLPCQARKRAGRLRELPQVFRDLPLRPFYAVAMDCFGPLPQSSGGFVHVLAIQCMLTRWVEVFPVTAADFNSVGLARLLIDRWSAQHSVAAQILTDRGSQFVSEVARAAYKVMGARKLYTTAHHPQTNGMVERFMASLAQMLAMVVDAVGSDWYMWLSHVAYSYNIQRHSTTQHSPFLLAKGFEPRLALHQLLGSVELACAKSGVVAATVG